MYYFSFRRIKIFAKWRMKKQYYFNVKMVIIIQ